MITTTPLPLAGKTALVTKCTFAGGSFMELLLGAYSRRVRLRRVEALCASYS
jgi:hypothetical protein